MFPASTTRSADGNQFSPPCWSFIFCTGTTLSVKKCIHAFNQNFKYTNSIYVLGWFFCINSE
jgi:hypothetical protein